MSLAYPAPKGWRCTDPDKPIPPTSNNRAETQLRQMRVAASELKREWRRLMPDTWWAAVIDDEVELARRRVSDNARDWCTATVRLNQISNNPDGAPPYAVAHLRAEQERTLGNAERALDFLNTMVLNVTPATPRTPDSGPDR